MPTAPPLQPHGDKLSQPDGEPCRVVGIGAGAGGLEAIQLLFSGLPKETKPAFVICRYVQSGLSDPLGDLLCTQTSLPVVQAEDGTVLEAGRIHLVKPRTKMILLKDRLVRLEKAAADEAALDVSPIDVLMHSLAASAGPAAIAVILSGSGEDGVRGCATIRKHGGLVLAQQPESTEFPEMPHHIIEAGLASAVAKPGGIADLIARRAGRGQVQEAPQQGGSGGDDEALQAIMALLAERYAIEAHAYRPSLVAKRVRRRLGLSTATTLSDYAALLKRDDGELAALHDDLLIRVTSFFRDPEAFATLQREAIPVLVEQMSAECPVRIWVPACATGEEAYSLAMLILDRARQADKTLNFEIIASDRHASALDQAQKGRYHQSHIRNVPPSLAERYLQKDAEHASVLPDLRRHVRFICHDILKAPPPDGIDLVSCRNLLIYLAAAAGERALAACCKALRPGGFLFLGASEQPGANITGLDVIHGKWRIYRKPAAPPVSAALKRLQATQRLRPAEPIVPVSANVGPTPPPPDPEIETRSDDMNRVLVENQRLLESTIDTLLISNDTLRRRTRSLRAENHRLLHSQAALDDAATLIAYDLKMPLRAAERLAAQLQSALSSGNADGDALFLLQPIQGRLAALSKIIDDLLAYAREGPAEAPDLEPVDFGKLLSETLTLLGLPKKVRVLIRPPSLQITTWRIPLACIFRNLLSLALERIGNTAGTIQIDAMQAGCFLDISMVDDGQHQGDRQSDLGLAIAQRFLEAVGGQLTSEPKTSGPGHEMRFSWPIKTPMISTPSEKNVTVDLDRTDANDG